MDACLNCPYRVQCIFDSSFPCFLDDPDLIKLKDPYNYGFENTN